MHSSSKTLRKLRKTDLSTEFSKVFRKCPNASERIQMHPSRSQQVRASLKTSITLQKPRKLANKNRHKFEKTSRKLVPRLVLLICQAQGSPQSACGGGSKVRHRKITQQEANGGTWRPSTDLIDSPSDKGGATDRGVASDGSVGSNPPVHSPPSVRR